MRRLAIPVLFLVACDGHDSGIVGGGIVRRGDAADRAGIGDDAVTALAEAAHEAGADAARGARDDDNLLFR